jgi:hypothetical protein
LAEAFGWGSGVVFGHRFSFSESAEEQQPESKCKKCSQTGIHHDQRLQLRLQLDVHKEQPDGSGEQNAYDSAQYPRGKKRAKKIKRGRTRASRNQQHGWRGSCGRGHSNCAPASRQI